MKIEGEHRFAAPREAVWRAVMDPEVIARIMPGCDKLDKTGENAYEGAMTIKVGPVQGAFQGSVELSDLVEPESYRLHMKGKGAPGFVDADGRLRLEPGDGGGTVLRYEIEAKIGGRIASVGQRLLDSSTRVIARQSLEGLDAQIQAREGGGGAGEAAAPAVPSTAAFASGFAKGLLAEMIPPERRPLVFGLAAVVLLAAAWLIARGCAA